MRLPGERVLNGLAVALATALAACGGAGSHDAAQRGGAGPPGVPVPGTQHAGIGEHGGLGERATDAQALRLVRAAAQATLAGTAQVEYTLRGAGAFGATSAPVQGSGAFDFRSGKGSETIDLGETGKQEPGNEAVVFLPSQVYLQPKSSTTAVLPKGKRWMSATLAGSDSVRTNFPAFALQAEAVNPQFLLTELAAARPLGIDLVGERPARAYEVSVDLTRALGRLAGPTASVLGQAIQSELAASSGHLLGQGRPVALVTAWLDGRHVVQLRAAPPGAGAGTATMTLCCFDTNVTVDAPAAAQVVDITALTPSGERENNGGGDSDGG